MQRTSSDRVRCFCVRYCGGPLGPGHMLAYSTARSHRREANRPASTYEASQAPQNHEVFRASATQAAPGDDGRINRGDLADQAHLLQNTVDPRPQIPFQRTLFSHVQVSHQHPPLPSNYTEPEGSADSTHIGAANRMDLDSDALVPAATFPYAITDDTAEGDGEIGDDYWDNSHRQGFAEGDNEENTGILRDVDIVSVSIICKGI